MRKSINLFISIIAALFFTSCDGVPDVVFDEPIPGRLINLSNKIGDSFTIVIDEDTIPVVLDYNKKTKVNYISVLNADTIFEGTITKRNEMFLLNKKYDNGTYKITALRFTGSTVTGLADGWSQAEIIKRELEKAKYESLILDTNERYTIHAEKKEGRELFRYALDQLEPMPIIRNDEGGFTQITPSNDLGNTSSNDFIEKVFPNPTESSVKIELNSFLSINLKIYNLDGKVIKDLKINNREIDLNLSELESGSYILEIKNVETGGVERKKLIKK